MNSAAERLREGRDRQELARTIHRIRQATRETFPGTSDGLAYPATPKQRRSRTGLSQPVSVVRGTTVVHHVTLLSTLNQSIASGGGRLRWEWYSEGPPNQRRGFNTLAANGVPALQIPVDITGVMNLRLTGSWGEEQSSGETVAKGLYWREMGAITVRLIRNGSTIGEREYDAGPVVDAAYEVIDDGWEVVAGDVLEVELPNSSAEAQRHRQAELTYKIIELAANMTSKLIEEFYVDSKASAGNTSSTVLASGETYTLLVIGNYRGVDGALGSGADAILFTSSGEPDEDGNIDADFKYASDSQGGTGHSNNFELDLGSGFSHVEPDGGQATAAPAGHRYEYTVTGEGSELSARLTDIAFSDNNGQLQIQIYRGTL